MMYSKTLVDQVRKAGYAQTITDGRWNTCTFRNAQGLELYRYTWVTGKDHVNMPAENELLWETWFKHWSLDNGVRSWDGTAVQ